MSYYFAHIFLIVQTNKKFLDDYVDRTSLTGRVLNADASKVHSYIVYLISENVVAEQKLLPHKYADDSRVECFTLQKFYKGVGANVKDVLTSKNDIQEIFYGGEKPLHMWWGKFEGNLTNDFAVIDKNAAH